MPFYLVLFVTALSCLRAFAAPETSQKITWIRWDDPPMFIFEGPFKGQGILDVVEKELLRALPQYQHEKIEGNIPRLLKEAEQKSQICNMGSFKSPEWENYFYFSKPIFISPSNGVLLKESHLSELKGWKSPYSLQDFLDKKSDWTLGVGRLYGGSIDEIIKKHQSHKRPKILTVASSVLVHRMLHADRVQYSVGYPFEAAYYNELFGEKENKVIHLPIRESQEFVEVVVGCPKSKWGERVIADVNEAISKKAMLEIFRKSLDRWLSPHDQKKLEAQRAKLYKKYYPKL